MDYATCTNWREAFENPKNEQDLKKAYRRLVKVYHSDERAGHKDCFVNLTDLYNQGKEFFISRSSKPGASKSKYVKFTDVKTRKEITLPYIFEDSFEDSTVYFGYTKMAIVLDQDKGKYYNNFIMQVNGLKYPNDAARQRFVRVIPHISDKVITAKGNHCIVMDKTSEIIPLHKLVGQDYPDKYRHSVWIINRLYDLACLLRYNNKVFNGFNIRNLYISPDYHSILLLNGWQFCVDARSRMIGTTKDIYDIMSIKCKDSKVSEELTDLESIKMIGRQLFYKDAPKEFREFFEKASCGDAMKDWDIWDKCIDRVYGTKRVFIHWEGPLVEAYKTN